MLGIVNHKQNAGSDILCASWHIIRVHNFDAIESAIAYKNFLGSMLWLLGVDCLTPRSHFQTTIASPL